MFYDDIVYEFGEIMQNKGHFAVQGHRFGTNRKLIYDFLLVINTNLPPILLGDTVFQRLKIAIFSASEVTTIWRYTNVYIIIIIIIFRYPSCV